MKKIQWKGERGKMERKYEGQFKIIKKARVAAYYLEDAEGKKTKRLWNACHLRKYYA